MIQTQRYFVLIALVVFCASSHGSGGANIQRGGLGFLFPDHNSFSNPGQFAASHGMAVEGLYTRSSSAVSLQTVTPSFVYGNGNLGFGVYGTRFGAPDLGTGVDVIGAGLGYSLFKGRMTVGVGYDRVLGEFGGDGGLTATMTLNPANRRGASLGVAYKRDLDTSTSGLIAGAGFSFSSNNNLEANFYAPDINQFSNMQINTYFTVTRQFFYFGAGYLFASTNNIALMPEVVQTGTSHGVAARLGFMLGRTVDLSVQAKHYLGDGNPITYGASLRASF